MEQLIWTGESRWMGYEGVKWRENDVWNGVTDKNLWECFISLRLDFWQMAVIEALQFLDLLCSSFSNTGPRLRVLN